MLKKRSTKLLLAILTILVVILAGFEVKSLLEASNSKEEVKITTKRIGPYIVSTNQTAYQQKVETQLQSALDSGDAVQIVSEASKFFISDYFTLKDKTNKNNVGGMGFIFIDNQAQFKVNAIASYYRDLTTYQDAYGKANMPIVTNVTTGTPKKVSKSLVKVSDNSSLQVKSVYDIPVKWQYEENDKLKEMNLINKASLRFV
ncbi:hypothetical protein LJB88_05235, partial [Erysipelotrichaceae bacterium OttesenSCG-928-M19]|nr:hypothetical protein [Erysipelotrichaceae bacterium OttesenSCG-928-M19]